ncbi:MAG: hypothetical protein HZB76_06690 [Chlamydiae bacterium]|nr:hypothetical protein [Chlamydiota bacterium]
MKKIVTLFVFLTIATMTGAFAEEASLEANKKTVFDNPTWHQKYKTYYIRLGANGIPQGNQYVAAPSIALGKTFQEGANAIDVSSDIAVADKAYAYSAAKMLYKRYFPVQANNAMFVGIGGSFGGYKNTNYLSHAEFHGILTNAVIGYVVRSGEKLQTMVNFGVGIPTIKTSRHADSKLPVCDLSLGLGY